MAGSAPAPVPTPRTAPAPAPTDPRPASPSSGPASNSADVATVKALAAVMQRMPNRMTTDYYTLCVKVATYLGFPPSPLDITQITIALAQDPNNSAAAALWKKITGRTLDLSTYATKLDELVRSKCSELRAKYLEFVEKVVSFSNVAKSYGYSPPDNPFVEIARLNAAGTINISNELASTILYNVDVYRDLVYANENKAIDWDSGKISFAHISHVRLSFDGYGSSDPATALMKFMPSMDQLKAEKARQAFASIDFGQRIPHILFTLEYAPMQDQPIEGIVLGWRKMSDASGYTLTRRGVISGQTKTINLTNGALKVPTEALRSYAGRFAGGFFPSVDPNAILLYLDEDIQEHDYYIYTLQAYQLQSEMRGTIFTVDSVPVSLTTANKLQIRMQMAQLDPSLYLGNGEETISPWPIFSHYLLGNTDYDWVLSAVNVRSSINRRESKDVTRKYSYLNAHTKFLIERADAGTLVKPKDISLVKQKVDAAIQKYGIGQVVQELLTETGMTYYFDGRDAADDSTFDRAGSTDADAGQIFQVVAAAIDLDTATLDLNALGTNLSLLLGQQGLGVRTNLDPAGDARPEEISIPDPDAVTDESANDRIQFLTELGDMSETVDLTTFEGISKLMRTIRIYSDFGPDRLEPPRSPSHQVPIPGPR
jgi:hypothetical protein